MLGFVGRVIVVVIVEDDMLSVCGLEWKLYGGRCIAAQVISIYSPFLGCIDRANEKVRTLTCKLGVEVPAQLSFSDNLQINYIPYVKYHRRVPTFSLDLPMQPKKASISPPLRYLGVELKLLANSPN